MPQGPAEDDVELKVVVGSILSALQEAKRLGDLESTRLLDAYKKDKSLSAFSVPAFVIAEVELELRFSVVGPSDKKAESGKLPGLNVNITAASLKELDPSQIQLMRLKIAPVSPRVYEETKER